MVAAASPTVVMNFKTKYVDSSILQCIVAAGGAQRDQVAVVGLHDGVSRLFNIASSSRSSTCGKA